MNSQVITIRLNHKDIELLRSEAAKLRLTMSSLLRMRALSDFVVKDNDSKISEKDKEA
ncbi:MAG: hypothetical protein HQK96_09760 [Nitrospirae bacterium]|nr:hypothetical protein [Nitrospirota bacterium]MBF0554822.1 hypothetical protein [Nitrospirota bacterium]